LIEATNTLPIRSTFLTLVLLPVLYEWVERKVAARVFDNENR